MDAPVFPQFTLPAGFALRVEYKEPFWNIRLSKGDAYVGRIISTAVFEQAVGGPELFLATILGHLVVLIVQQTG